MFEAIKSITLELENKETIDVKFHVPSCIEMEELEKKGVSNSNTINKFVISIDGFESVKEFLNTPGTAYLAAAIASEVISSCMIKAQVKNSSLSSTASV